MTQVLDGGPDINLRCGLPMRQKLFRRGFRVALLGVGLWLVAPHVEAQSQMYCLPVTADDDWACSQLQKIVEGQDGGVDGDGNGENGGDLNGIALPWDYNTSVENVNVNDSTRPTYGVIVGGIAGNGGDSDEGNGGDGGSTDAALSVLTLGAGVTVIQTGTPPPYYWDGAITGGGVLATAQGGNGGTGAGGDGVVAGVGGNAGGSQIDVTDANVSTSGDRLAGLVIFSLGGIGGTAGCQVGDGGDGLPGIGCVPDGDGSDPSYYGYAGNNGGTGGSVLGYENSNGHSNQVSVTAATRAVSITTNGYWSPAIAAYLVGGAGGAGGTNAGLTYTEDAGYGGAGGNISGDLNILLSGTAQNPVTLQTSGSTSPGIIALSLGGLGGYGGSNGISSIGHVGAGGVGGAGGSGGLVNISLSGASIVTAGDTSSGIFAQSAGGAGNYGGVIYGGHKGKAGAGGDGGDGGDVTITLDSASGISTQGDDSAGIIAQSVSGAGGAAGSASAVIVVDANGGDAGDAGDVTVTNNGTISTAGGTARGILAQSLPGVGGSGGDAQGIFYGEGGQGGSGGNAGTVTVTNNGSITTTGSYAQGILAQSIGGSGGAGGNSSGLVAIGGNASTNPFDSEGGAVHVNSSSGTITTYGTSAMGIVGQSIGGGGGDGGAASSFGVSVGGAGGAGGDGGAVSSVLDGTAIHTYGDYAHALLLQSVGGGGGNGGSAFSTTALVSVAIGGASGGGGAGGSVTASLDDISFYAVGSKSPGVVAQSIGGGGGAGGNAFGLAVGPGFSASYAAGGSGGAGGDGGSAQVTMSGGTIMTGQNPLLIGGSGNAVGCAQLPCSTLPIDAYGVVVQSIGGGGGIGGSATAESIAVAIPVPPDPSNQISVSVTGAVGGSGGHGGDGGAVQFTLSDGGQILTNGQGSTAVLAQSIGGGGGAGGDSSALALSAGPYNPGVPDAGTSSLSVDISVAAGGSGGDGGKGDTVGVVIGDNTPDSFSNPTSITTYGDFANGVTAQSVGGGGGNAGFGSSNSQGFSTDYNLSVDVTLGSQGGGGGAGGEVTVDLYAGHGITTFGSGALGILAQSIGGGGGASQGGSVGIGGSSPGMGANFSTEMTVSLGHAKGVAGGAGDDVTVSAMAPIITHGGDATGIVAQSIGGGGGLGGSAGADAQADNPVLQGLDERQAMSNWSSFFAQMEEDGEGGENNGSWAANLQIMLGGNGGSGNVGGTVNAYLYAPIVTNGDWAKGIVAQSVGGGGGVAGTAAASGTGSYSYVTVNYDVAVGGSAGTGGDGGSVKVELDEGNQGGSSGAGNNTGIYTAGLGAAGVIAQSIGGGGGIGGDGSDSATGLLSVGGGAYGDGVVSGDGGTVLVNYYNPLSTTIATKGDVADGVILQSIGGGGGMASAGSGLFITDFQQSGSLELSAGGGEGSSGAGGAVTFEPNGSDTPITISTAGDDSFGILAQSIGGGGGIVTSQPSSFTSTTLIIGGDAKEGNSNDGGAVSVTLGSEGSIFTTGIGAHGIVAQSVGGGGGVVRLINQAGDTPTLDTTVPANLSNAPAQGDGSTVDVEVDGIVSVFGAGAVGILAQSVGSGGGLVMNGGNFYAGSPNFNDPSGLSSGYGEAVTVTANGTVSAIGVNGIGIFAQSTGYSNGGNGPVTVSIGGGVTGGSGQAAQSDSAGNSTQLGSSAVQVDSPNGSKDNGLTVYSGGSLNTVSGTDGTAIVQTGGGTLNVANYGAVTGSVYMGKNGTLTNALGGAHNSGSDVVGHVVNHGVVNIGLPSEVRATRVSGDFTQTAPGRLGVTIDSLLDAADYLRVAGAASLDGVIAPTAISLLPGTVEVAEGNTLVSTAEVLDSLVFRWDASQSGNVLSITPTANFRPGGVSLNDSQASLADYFGRAWDSADRNFAKRFAGVSNINDGDTYKTALDAFSSRTALAQSIALANSAGTILGAGMSCPVFGVDTVLLGEDDCAWAQVSGSWTDQSATDDTLGYDVNTTTYRVGAQHEIARDWYLGASFGYGHNQADMDGGSSGDGDIYDGSVTLKRVMGPWQFAGSFAIAGGSFDTNRRINIPGVASDMLTSDSSMFMAGGRLRAAYEFAFEDWYVRPYGDLDIIYTNMRGFQESGGIYALDVGGSSKTSVALSPMVEFGGRLDLEGDATLRAYAAFGLSYRPDNERTVESSFVGASSGTFTDYIESPELLGRIDVGMQLFAAGGYELKGGYTADIGDSFVSQSASARLAYRF